MTRDEEIRHDLARQWQELEGKKTDLEVGMIAQDIRDFIMLANRLRKVRSSRGRVQGTRRQVPRTRLISFESFPSS